MNFCQLRENITPFLKGRNSLLVFAFFFFTAFFVRGQEGQKKETVVVRKKVEYVVYRGENQGIGNWYIVTTPDNQYFLLNLEIPQEDVVVWFQKFKDSQNLYKANLTNDYTPLLNFTKENEPNERIIFLLKSQNAHVIELLLRSTAAQYQFTRVSSFVL